MRAERVGILGTILLVSAMGAGDCLAQVSRNASAAHEQAQVIEPVGAQAGSARRSFIVRGSLIGVGAGLLSGQVVRAAYAGGAACTGPGCSPPPQVPKKAVYLWVPLGGAVLGGVLGALIAPADVAPTLSASAGGMELAWSIPVG